MTHSKRKQELEQVGSPPSKKPKYTNRKERNEREKERSHRIAEQINEIRDLLGDVGHAVVRGTKSEVLSEAINFLRQSQSLSEQSQSPET
jgi:phenylalanyl-tRNA synthetase alpha subunit